MMTIATKPLTAIFLVSIRLGTVLLFSPIEAIRILPIHARLLLVFILSIVVVAYLPIDLPATNELALFLSALTEFFNGLILSISLYATFAVFQIAGQFIDTQMGLNSLAILNPSEHSHDPLSGRLLAMLSVLFFFAMDGHHRLLQGLFFSFSRIPPGQHALFDGFAPILQQSALMFSLGLMLASPIVFGLLIVDMAAGVITRNMPQMNAYFLILPIKILLGYFMFGLLLHYMNPLMTKTFQLGFQCLKRAMS